MPTVGVQEFRRDIHRILREVREHGVTYHITYYGKLIAKLEPVAEPVRELTVNMEEFIAEGHALAAEISESWPDGLSAVDAVREGRREF